MTSIGIQCNIEHANCDSSSTSKSATVQAKNELLYDNDDRSEADGMSLSQTFTENEETSSDRAKETQDTSQEATINRGHLNPIFAPKHNGTENAIRLSVFENDSKNDTRTKKQKPCAFVVPFLRETETNDKDETALKTSSIIDSENIDIVSNPDVQNATVRQPDWYVFDAMHTETEEIKDNAEDIYLAENATEPCIYENSYPLPSIEFTQVSGDKRYLHGAAFTESDCSILKSDEITTTHVVQQVCKLDGNESTHEDKISRDFEDEQSSNIDQNGRSCPIQSQASNNILIEKDSKGQNCLSNRKHFTERRQRKNRNARMKQRISRRQRFRMGMPLYKVCFDAIILKQRCKGHNRKIKIKGKYGLGNKFPTKDDSTVKCKILGKREVKNTKKCKSLINKEGLNITYLPRTGDQLLETSINDLSSKQEISLKVRKMSCRCEETSLQKSGNKRDIQSKNILTKNHKDINENKSAEVKVKCKDDIQPKTSHTKTVIHVIDKLIIQAKKSAHVLYYFVDKFGTQRTINWHTSYSSIIKWTDLDFGSIQFTVAPARELIYRVDFENESLRRQTFCTYDNQDIVERLVRNGFFYSEGENKIVCYICGGRQGRLRAGDIPERAHHSGCQFHSEADPGNHNEVREREKTRSMNDNVRLQGSSNSTQTSPGSNMVSGRVHFNVLQVLIDYFRRQNDPGGGRGGRPITVIPPFPFDEAQEHRRHITVLPPRPDMNGGRRRRRITVLPPRPPSQEFVAPSHGSVIHTHQRTEPISTSSMPIPLPHRCVFCRTRPVSIRFEPCQHALACYLCSLNKVICIVCGESIVQISYMENRQ
ncbi:hypothetical protein ACJMK2_018994 [Sinanodonta woodiana]|uniref:RING-type domain-containing protein n=1 Tax=Sinanodonta woodiana TaxID=1069815 RepID=A0ABD3UGK6_SINWO